MQSQTNLSNQGTTSSTEPAALPPVDIFEDDAGITVIADLPGVSRDKLSVRVDAQELLIEATASSSVPSGMEMIYGEAQLALFRRQFNLSRELDASRIDAQLKDGVLRLTIPKSEEAKPRRIEVKTA